ncbi:MAG: mechanosensitive ion channel family protein [Rickettsiales bacterium]
MENIEQYLDMKIITTYAIEYGQAIIFALAIFIFGKWAAKGLTGLIRKAMRRSQLDETLVTFLGNIVYGLLFAFVVIAALSQLGVETTSLAAIFAAAGLAIGLALQGSLSNFAAGVLIIAFRPFSKGDYIEAAGTAGVVQEVGIFSTTLKSPDNKMIVVPNGAVTSDNIVNFSAHATRRIDFTFGIGYDDDIKKAKDILRNILDDDPRVLKDPAPVIGVSELADSSVNFVVRPWVKTEDYWSAYFDISEEVKLRFDKEGISIPFPQQDVHMYQIEKKAKAA